MIIDLYAHQKEAIDRMQPGSLLCGGVGSGKSRTALAYFFTKICDGKIDQVFEKPKKTMNLYIITTARKRDTKEWDDECAVFMLSQNEENSICGIQVHIDSWNNIGKYKEVKDSFFIFDEQRVVGYGAWAKTFIRIAQNNKWILLSATPGDSWMDYIPVFIANGFYKNKTDFVKKHVIYSRYTKFPKVSKYVNVGKLISNRKHILVLMPHKKKAVRHNKTVLVEYDTVLYNTVSKDRWNIYDDEPIQNISACCYLMRKVINSDHSRLEAIQRLIKDHPKMIVYYNFDYELELLRTVTDKDKIFEWNGHKHDPLPKSEEWVYLVQYTAGAEGWNCTTTDTIVFYSQNYSFKTMVQAAGRIDRLNTPFKDLYYIHLRSNAPIDRAISTTLRKKKTFNETMFMQKGVFTNVKQ